MPEHIFVYGTLLPGLAPAGLWEPVRLCAPVGRGSLPGRLYDLGPYPAAVPDTSAPGRVAGMVYRLPDRTDVLGALDAYEGCDAADLSGSLFVRRWLEVALDDGGRVSCWVYVYNRDPGPAPPIPDGDYLTWRARS
jgi:gamma-glutamylcyclotransferase (GGCT)/AIG2-like uncharacterized protein YtfP